jgi:regulator of sigma E protease
MALEIIIAVIGISILVVIHEAGHYLTARAVGMRVTRFSIGFGPAVFRYRPRGSPTVFQVCVIPFLAYVIIAGMNPAEEVDPADPELFPNKGVFARIATIIAGPVANYLAASILIFILALVGWPTEEPTKPMVIGKVVPSTPAAAAGLRPGDLVIEAEGQKIGSVADLRKVTQPRAGKPTKYLVVRDGKQRPFTITPARGRDGSGQIGVIARSKRVYVSLSPGKAFLLGALFPLEFTVMNLIQLAKMARTGDTEGIAGPVGIGKIVVEQAQRGVADFTYIMAIISVALGMFNLLPLPALDGGRLVFLGFELVTRRRPNEKMEAVIHTVGLLVLLVLMVLVTMRDIAG